MAKEIIGDACAFIAGVAGAKNRYLRIGTGMRDGDRISVKIDTLPVPGSGWEGWINIFPRDNVTRSKRSTGVQVPDDNFPPYTEDDIPF